MLEDNGNTLLTGPVIDQAALHGVVSKIRDLGIPLVSVRLVEPGHPIIHGTEPENHSDVQP